jgi:hypothetical protein
MADGFGTAGLPICDHHPGLRRGLGRLQSRKTDCRKYGKVRKFRHYLNRLKNCVFETLESKRLASAA